MRILKWLVLAMLLLAGAFVAVGMFVLGDKAHVERAITIDARPATVFTVLNGFRQFEKWSPWAQLDPQAKVTVSGPPMGVGARHAWTSEDPNVGSGSQEIVEARPHDLIRVLLRFDGFDADSFATYTITPEGEGTKLVWSYDTDFQGNVMNRWFGLMMDRMLGPDYERGLAQLKTLVESLPREDIAGLAVELVTVKPLPIAFASGAAGPEDAVAVLADRLAAVQAYIAAQGLAATDAPLAITREYDDETRAWRFDAAIPVDRGGVAVAPESGVQTGTSYGGLALKAAHRGPNAAMEPLYRQLVAYKSIAGFEDNGDSWEQYLSDPATVPEAEQLTHVFWPVK